MPSSSIIDSFRHGKPDHIGRQLIKIKFDHYHSKILFLKNYKQAVQSIDPLTFKQSFARHDLTINQLKEDKAIRAELYQRRTNGETNLVIFRGAIVTRRNFASSD